jgi:hypothetical protein
MTSWGAPGVQGPADHGIRWRFLAGPRTATDRRSCRSMTGFAWSSRGAPSGIRTCAHGSGGGRPHLSNLHTLPARTRSLVSRAAGTIPRIFRIMEASAVTTRTLQGMVRVRSGQAPAWPMVSDRSARRGSRVKRDLACTLTGSFPPVLVALRPQSRLMLEGRTRTLSGPSPDLTSSVSDRDSPASEV